MSTDERAGLRESLFNSVRSLSDTLATQGSKQPGQPGFEDSTLSLIQMVQSSTATDTTAELLPSFRGDAAEFAVEKMRAARSQGSAAGPAGEQAARSIELAGGADGEMPRGPCGPQLLPHVLQALSRQRWTSSTA